MNRYELRNLFAMLGVDGPDLLTRSFGRRAFPVLENELQNVPDGQTLLLDCREVTVMDTSFVDETLLELGARLGEGRYGDRYLILQDPSPEVVDNLEGALARRRSKVAFLMLQGTGRRIIGHIEPNLAETWRLALELAELTARELADRLNLEINTASMRLRKLHDARLLSRREVITQDGRQHVYRLPI